MMSPLARYICLAGWGIAVLAGPFGSYDTMGWPVRLVYWGVVISFGLTIGFFVRGRMLVLAGVLGPARFDLALALIVSAALTPLIWALRGWLDPLLSHADLSLWSIAFNTFPIVAGIVVLRRLTGAEEPAGYGRRRLEQAPAPRLLRRLSREEGIEILHLSGNDHSVDVATSEGVETLRLRLADAIAEMEPVRGVSTHRSHWVALVAISGLERENGGKLFVRLCNGERVPVSRKYRSLLEEAGWTERDPADQAR